MYKQKTVERSRRTSRDVLAKANSFSLHPSDNQKVILDFYASLDTPVSLACALLYKYGEYDQLVAKEINPFHYNDPVVFRDDFASISFLRKHETLKTSYDKKGEAISAFKKAELTCKSTNERIKSYLQTGQINPACEWILHMTIRKIDRILGSFDIDEVLDFCGWGPGVTTLVKGSDTSGSHKFDRETAITRDLYDLVADVAKLAYPNWEALHNVTFETGNTVITVPKNAKIDRTIAIEPGLNSWFQKGLGSFIRGRLRRAGYNLNSDLKNQRGAYIGSLTNQLATVDFKAASDTISTSLVELLLPPVWFTVLNAARSKYYSLDGQFTESYKFSSMGNGFTFELESLIFLALGLSTCEYLRLDDTAVSIFGDDLILPSGAVPKLTEICDFAGFTVNTQKSYASGYFRESCGSYYFKGLDVKPVFLKRDVKQLKDVYRILNTIRTFSHTRNCHFGCDRKFRSLWVSLVHKLPSVLRLFGPIAGGDSVIHENLMENGWRAHNGWDGFFYPGLPSVPLTVERETNGLLLHRLHSPSRDRSLGNEVSLRARTKMVFKKSMFVSQWYEFGNWC